MRWTKYNMIRLYQLVMAGLTSAKLRTLVWSKYSADVFAWHAGMSNILRLQNQSGYRAQTPILGKYGNRMVHAYHKAHTNRPIAELGQGQRRQLAYVGVTKNIWTISTSSVAALSCTRNLEQKKVTIFEFQSKATCSDNLDLYLEYPRKTLWWVNFHYILRNCFPTDIPFFSSKIVNLYIKFTWFLDNYPASWF